MASKLRIERTIKGCSQFKLRLLTGIHQSKISMIENGLIEPSASEKERISKALGVAVGEIFARTDG